MKANRKFIERKDSGVSELIGVILMVAIIVAISAVVYYYVTSLSSTTHKDTIICGKIKYIPVLDTWKCYGILQMNDESLYSIYYIDDYDYSLMKFAYSNECNVSIVINHYYDNDMRIFDKSVTLLDCGCINE